MSKATVSIYFWGIYIVIAGLGFLIIPNVLLPLVGLPQTTEAWIRVLGLVMFFLGGYYLTAARYNLIPFYRATAIFRLPFSLVLFLLVILGYSGPGLAIFGVLDIIGAAWTWWGLRSDTSSSKFAPQLTGQ